MAFDFGWKANDIRISIWRGDKALKDVPVAALEAWREEPEASHLEPYVKPGEKATLVQLRNLTPDELRLAYGPYADALNNVEAWTRACLLAFRVAVSFVDMPAHIVNPATGDRHPTTVRERGVRMLANELVMYLEENNPGMVGFYGSLILDASSPTGAEKKASSPPSTQTPSAAAESIPAITEPSSSAQGA